ncbi:DUF7033 domain-containing protein [Hymenobacter koreensis]|uniref:Polysaccharide deacetylase family protein n=1 Tax=Hymenobacter koreensis TaxID=1084523 RepID=A0ABP8JBG1_9BACT
MPASIIAPAVPVAAASISSEVRLAYVLQHFWQAYEPTSPVTIGVPGQQAQVEVAVADAGFFDQRQPYPPAPIWHEWQGREVPFFFGPAAGQPLLTLQSGRALVHADLVSAAFYLLSGWQEYFSEERDQHGRFPYAASVQHQYGFVDVPVVNCYFEVLRTAVEHVTGEQLRPRRWLGGAKWAAFVTHDVDSLFGSWKAPAKAALQQGRLLETFQIAMRSLAGVDAWNNLEAVQATARKHGAPSTFFMLGSTQKAANGTPNADYRVSAPGMQRRLRNLQASGAELSVHGSIGTATDAAKLRREKQLLPGTVSGNRFHYLSWEPRLTPGLVDAEGFGYDSTLGFPEHFGFRNSYCLPFQPFNFATGRACSFLEIPLNVMDATLHHPSYLQLAPQEILPALEPMLQEIERFGGVCTLLWHNDHFDPANTVTGPRQFAALMEYLRSRNVAFMTGQQIVNDQKPS